MSTIMSFDELCEMTVSGLLMSCPRLPNILGFTSVESIFMDRYLSGCAISFITARKRCKREELTKPRSALQIAIRKYL